MSENISIVIDLDSELYKKDLESIESSSVSTAKKVGKAFDDSVAKTIDDKVVISFKNLSQELANTANIATKITTGFAATVPVLAFLENRFGLISSAAKKLGFDFSAIVKKSKDLEEAFVGFVVGENSLKAVRFQAALLANELKIIDSNMLSLINGIDKIGGSAVVASISASVAGISLLRNNILKSIMDVKQLGSELITTFAKPKGILELTSSLGLVSGALLLTSEAMIHSENATTRFLGTLAKLGAIITGGLAAWISLALFKIADLAQIVGTKLVQYFQQASEIFVKTSSSVVIFTSAVDTMNRSTNNAIGTGEEWLDLIDEISKSLNISGESLRKSAQEIVLVGSSMGLTTDQMKQLLRVSSEYAKVNLKDVFDTTVAMVNALNGNSQAVQALGIKLSEASVQQFIFKQGMTSNLQTMSESEKVQVRFNKLLSQYSEISGLGSIAANTLADQQNRLKINTERLSASLGRGAAIIEQNNLVAFALNTVLDNVNDTVISTAGFFGALGSRLIQAAGFIAEVTFKLFALTKAITLLDVLLKSKTWDEFSNKKIPLIGKSFQELISLITGSNVQLKSSKDLLFSLGQAVINQFKSFIGVQNNASSGTSTFSSILKVLSLQFKSVYAFLVPFLVPFAKLAVISGAVVGGFVLVKNVFEELEKRTKVFSSLWGIFTDELSRTASVFAPIVSFFGRVSESIKELASKGFGLFVFGLSKVVQALTELALKNPFNVFSQQTIAKISEVNGKLQQFSSDLQMVAFDISRIPMEAERAIAGSADKSTVNIEALVQKLNALRDQFKDFGLTDVEVIRKREAEALETLRLSYENKLIAEKEYQTLRQQVIQDANDKVKELDAKAAQDRQKILSESNRIINQGLANALSGGIQNIVKSVASGENIFKNFSSFIVQTFGDLAIQLGQFFIATGLATAALLKLSPGAMIAAGAGLVALGAILKSFVGKGLGGGGGGGVAPIGAQPSPGEFTTPDVASPESVEREKPTTNVSVVVQGSLVRQEELGQFITETLNESFAKQGVTLTDARFA